MFKMEQAAAGHWRIYLVKSNRILFYFDDEVSCARKLKELRAAYSTKDVS